MSDEKLDKIITELSRLNTAVLGDPEAGNKGLGSRVSDLEDNHEELKQDLTKRLSWLKGGAWLASIVFSIIVFFKDHIKWI